MLLPCVLFTDLDFPDLDFPECFCVFDLAVLPPNMSWNDNDCVASVLASVGEFVVTGGFLVGSTSVGDAEGVIVIMLSSGEIVGEPSGKAGQNVGHALPRELC